MTEANVVTWRPAHESVVEDGHASGYHENPDYMDEDPIIDRPEVTQAQLKTVFWLNIVAFVVQAAAGGALIYLTDPQKRYNIYSYFPTVNSEGIPTGAGDAVKLFYIPLGYLSAAFLLLSAIDHFLVFTVAKSSYEVGLVNEYNIYRWLEYSISASVMRVMIAILSGISDIHTLVLIFGLTATTMFFGLAFELENSNRPLGHVRWSNFWFGFIPHMFAWAVIFSYFFVGVSRSGDAPAFVWCIIIILFALDLTFAIVLFFQWRGRGCWYKYVNGEIGFIILSLTSKQLLAWLNFFGSDRG
jgi:hypothetical protein